jgi:hypothetical protein
LVHVFCKKGISPFVSVILIVAMAVVIAVLVINWSYKITTDTTGAVDEKITKETACGIAVGLSVLRDSRGYQKACLNSTSEELAVVFENKGSRLIEKIHYSVLTAESISAELNVSIVPGGVIVARLAVNETSPSSIQQAVFTPAITINDKTYWCTDNAIVVQGSAVGVC